MEPMTPEPVQRIIGAMVSRAVARCDAGGINLADFYAALRTEQELHPHIGVTELFARTYRRLGMEE